MHDTNLRSSPELTSQAVVAHTVGDSVVEAVIEPHNGMGWLAITLYVHPSRVMRVNASQQISARGLALIKSFEGLRLSLYNDANGNCTIGYGHLVHAGNCGGHPAEAVYSRGIDGAEAERILAMDVSVAANAVALVVTVPLSDSQFDALTSFAFNVGAGAFGLSQLLIEVNAGRFQNVRSELMRWIHGAGGVVLPGLVRRRQAEADLFEAL